VLVQLLLCELCGECWLHACSFDGTSCALTHTNVAWPQEWKAQAERTTHLLEVMEVIAAKTERGLVQRALQGWVEHWLAWQQEQELEDTLARCCKTLSASWPM
jgi:hypothetical protein